MAQIPRDGTIPGGAVCLTITIVLVLEPTTESAARDGTDALLHAVAQAVQQHLPVAALGEPPVTSTLVALPTSGAR